MKKKNDTKHLEREYFVKKIKLKKKIKFFSLYRREKYKKEKRIIVKKKKEKSQISLYIRRLSLTKRCFTVDYRCL